MSKSQKIFESLLELDPSLQGNREMAMKIIDKLLEEKPDTQFDEAFAAALKAKLAEEIENASASATVSDDISGVTSSGPNAGAMSLQKNPIVTSGVVSRIKNFFTSRFFLSTASLAVACLAIFAAWYVYDLRTGAPEVLAGNWSFEYRKIPYDVPSIDLTFSRDIAGNTVTPANIKIFPAVQSTPEVKNGNTISLKLAEKLKIGERYTIELSPEIASVYGVKFGKTKFFEFEAVAGVKVTSVIPAGNEAALGKPILAFFSIPVIPLSSLTKKDSLPCPFSFEPAIPGKCRWLSSSVVQFDPENPLIASNEYKVKVSSAEGFLYPLSEEYKGAFSTSRIKFLSNALLGDLASDTNTEKDYMDPSNFRFTPSKGIPLRFSASVKKEDLAKALHIYDDSDPAQHGGKMVPFSLSGVTGGEISAAWRVFASDSAFEFGKKYRVEISAELPPAYGNLSLETPVKTVFTSAPLVNSTNIQKEVFSSTGAVIDSLYIPSIEAANKNTPVIPMEKANISIHFSEAVEIPENSIYLESATFSKVPCALSYQMNQITKPNGETVKEASKSDVECRTIASLTPNTAYNLVITPAVSKGLRASEKIAMTTPPTFTIDPQVKLVSNTELCVYASSVLSYASGSIRISPETPIRDIRKDGDGFWNAYKDSYDSTPQCPSRAGLTASVVGVRLAPHVKYSVEFTSSQKDVYDDTLTTAVKTEVTGGDILPRDKYVFSSLSRELNVIPENVPLVNAFQTINSDSLKISVCEMDLAGYSKYLNSSWNETYVPNCVTQTEKDMSVRNLAWNTSVSKFDIEKEILGRSVKTPFVLVRSSVMGSFNSLVGKRDPDRETLQMFVRSSLSLTLESAANTRTIFATSIDGKETPNNLSFEFYGTSEGGVSKLNDISAKWNPDTKLYTIIDSTKLFERIGFGSVAFVVARGANGQYGVVATQHDQLGNYDFGYNAGMDASTKDYAYVYTDRPIYKAGDSVYFKGLLRTFEARGYKKSQAGAVSARILDEEWNLFKEISLNVDKNSNFSGEFTLPKDSKFGRFHFEIYTAKTKGELAQGIYVYNDGYFYIEAYKKPTFRAGVGIDKKDSQLGDSLKIQISPTYYFGGKLPATTYSYSVGTQSYFFDAKDYSDYQFGEGYARFDCLYWGQCSFRDSLSAVQKGEIGTNGNGQFDFALPTREKDDNKNDLAEKIYTFNVDVTDPDTGKTVSDSVSSVLHTTDGYAGLKLPYWIDKKSGITGEGILLGLDATPKSGEISLEFLKHEWKNVKKQGVDGAFYNEYGLEVTSESKTTVSADKSGKFAISYAPKGDGEYEVRASYTGKNGKTYTSASTVYVDSNSYVSWNNANNSVTEMVAEKNLLKIGETAALTVKSPVKSGNMFVSIEKDDVILKSYVAPITSYSPRIEIPITEDYLPNIYVKVFLVGQDAGMQLPVYKRALSVLKVSTASKKLNIDIKADKQNYLPGSPVTLAVLVTDSLGRPVSGGNGSLSIVDESVLALMGNPKKNPFAFFYDMKRYLGVETMASLAYLIEKLEVKNIGNGEKGGAGDAVKWGDAKKKRGVFKDTASWTADFTTDAQGRAIIKVAALPDNLTTWVVEAIVSTPEDNRIGIADISISSNKTVMVMDNLPRFFRSGDEVTLSPVVFNRTGKESDFTVSLKSEMLDISSTTQVIHLKDGESRAVPFAVVPKYLGPSSSAVGVKIDMEAKSNTTGEVDSLEYTLPLENSVLYETVSTIGHTDSNSFDEKIDLSWILKTGGVLSVRFGATPLAFLTDGVDYLANYPYGCAEQKTSAIAPNIAMKKLFDAANLPFDLEAKKVQKYIDKEQWYKEISLAETFKDYLVSIGAHTKLGGGIGYWENSEYADFEISSLVLRTVSDLESLGIKVDAKWKTGLVGYLKARFYANFREGCMVNRALCVYPEEDRLEAITSLLAAGVSTQEIDKMRALIDQSKLSPLANLTYLKLISDEREKIVKTDKIQANLTSIITGGVKDTLAKYLVYNPRGAFISMQGSLGRVEATAMLLDILAKNNDIVAGTPEITDNILRFIESEKQKDGSFGSTRDTAAVMRAIAVYLEKNPDIQKTNMVAKAILNNELVLEKPIGKTDLFASFTKDVSLESLPDNSTLHFEKTGQGQLSYDIAMKYGVSAQNLAARDEGFLVETEYYDYNEYRTLLEKKKREYSEYELGNIAYESLKYPLDPASYLTPLTKYKVGQLVYVRLHIITPEVRDRVAFESFIPAGSELVNTILSTETKATTEEKVFDREELRDDRYFAYKEVMESGEYIGSYVLRMTHAGTYSVLPSTAFEFDRNEVFGRSAGKVIEIKK